MILFLVKTLFHLFESGIIYLHINMLYLFHNNNYNHYHFIHIEIFEGYNFFLFLIDDIVYTHSK